MGTFSPWSYITSRVSGGTKDDATSLPIGELGKLLRHLQVVLDAGTSIGVTDHALAEQSASRDDSASELAFGALVQRHGPMVLAVSRGTLRNHQDAEDAFQATFLVLARKAGSLWVRDSIAPAAWCGLTGRDLIQGGRGPASSRVWGGGAHGKLFLRRR